MLGNRLFCGLTLLILIAAILRLPAFGAPTQRAPISPPPAKWPVSGKRFALIIGVDSYQDAEISNLGGASNDAKALADALARHAGFPSDQIVLLTSNQPVGFQPTRANIIRRLSNLRQVVSHDDLLWISFAGHGIERDGQAYLLPMDAQLSSDISLLEDSAINVQSMRERIRQTGVGQVIFVLDACRNNPVAGRGITKTRLTDPFTRAFSFDVHNRDIRAFATLYATGAGQVAHEYKEKKQGYFTAALVEGLKGAAANEKGEVTLSRLVKYIQESVPKRVAIDLGSNQQQRPWADIQGYRADDLVVTITSPMLPTETASVAEALDANARSPKSKPDSKQLAGDPITGFWNGTYGPGAFPFTLRLKLDGKSVSGELTLEGIISSITSGTWDGEQLDITVQHNNNRIALRASLNVSGLLGKQYLNGSTNFWLWTAIKK